MKPSILGSKYDKIAQWWDEQHKQSEYGLAQMQRALQFVDSGGQALDIGCGSGGRFVRLLDSHGFSVTGIDVSVEMISIAKVNHLDHIFTQADICEFEVSHNYEFILAWDSIFHLPLSQQQPVLEKICNMLAPNGVLIYTFGDAKGEHESSWREDIFYYSSIGIEANLQILLQNGVKPLHLELDQYPERHVCIIAQRQATL